MAANDSEFVNVYSRICFLTLHHFRSKLKIFATKNYYARGLMLELAVKKARSSWRFPGQQHWRTIIVRARRFVRLPAHMTVTIGFVSDRTMKRMNTKYRGKRKTTDVLSFQYIKTKTSLEGDIIICVPQARRQARAIGNTLTEELSFLFVHGFLHLMGYDHERSTAEEERMFALQNKILGRSKILC